MSSFCCLFIDDDMFMQKAFIRMGQRLRPTWHFISVEDPLTWRQSLANQTPDIVVCDFLMPGMRGDKVLDEVAYQFPLALRVLLTGDTRDDVIAAAGRTAHFVLSKPYQHHSVTEIFDAVERLQSFPLPPHSRQALSLLAGIIPRPAVVQQFNTAVQSNDACIDDVARIIEKEPEIQAKLLQLANSPFLGFQRRTLSLNDAIKRLGLTVTQTVVMELTLMGPRGLALEEKRHESLSAKIFERALCARTLALQVGFKSTEIEWIFTLSLLMGLGDLYLASFMHESKGDDHHMPDKPAVVAAFLLTLWGYAEDMAETLLATEHLVDLEDPLSPAVILALANALCQSDPATEYLNHVSKDAHPLLHRAISKWRLGS